MKMSEVMAKASTTSIVMPIAAYMVQTVPTVYDIAAVNVKSSTMFIGKAWRVQTIAMTMTSVVRMAARRVHAPSVIDQT
jgi:hypothetical protein